MREVDVDEVRALVRELCIEANHGFGDDHLAALRRGLACEQSELGCEVLRGLLANNKAARSQGIALCQDTGYAAIFLTIGQDVHFVGGDLRQAIDAGVAQGYRDGYLRASLVRSAVDRTNTEDNTPAMVYTEIVAGEGIHLMVLIKGAGCDNMSAIKMLTPAQGIPAVEKFVLDTVALAGPNASPPVTVGVGIGGTFDKAAYLSKLALCRDSGQPNADPRLAGLEQRILAAINDTGIGPAGFGGTVTALAVHIESMSTHIAALPVAVNLDCHSHRVRKVSM